MDDFLKEMGSSINFYQVPQRGKWLWYSVKRLTPEGENDFLEGKSLFLERKIKNNAKTFIFFWTNL